MKILIINGVLYMIITDVKIRKTFDEGPMRAVASLTFDNELALHDVKVIYAREKYFVVMPSRKNPDGTFRDIVVIEPCICILRIKFFFEFILGIIRKDTMV